MRKSNWTAIVPAAGKSTRFESEKNKIFYKYKNKTILEHILLKVSDFSNRIILVVNKNDKKECKLLVKKFKKKDVKIVVQKKINGMATAIRLGLSSTNTKNFFTIWGDQLGLSKSTMNKTIKLHENNNFLVTFPAVLKNNPYTLINFKKARFLKSIKQSREIKISKRKGYSDCGFFCCKTLILKERLSHLIKSRQIITKKTKEFDFLHSLNILTKKYKIKVLKSSNIKDCVGINLKQDLNLL